MSAKRIALLAIILAIGGVIAYKQIQSRNTPVPSAINSGVVPKVILVADLSEAKEKCACGEIIRAVRAAQKKGIPTQEFTPDSNVPLCGKRSAFPSQGSRPGYSLSPASRAERNLRSVPRAHALGYSLSPASRAWKGAASVEN